VTLVESGEMMELFGFRFFEVFMSYVWLLRWPLVIVFAGYVGLQVRGFRPDERLQTALMFAYFFLVITSFWILKPIKKGLFAQYYDGIGGLDLLGWQLDAAQAELIAKILNLAVAFVAVTVFTLLSRRLRRQQLTYAFSGFFICAFGLYSFVLEQAGAWIVWTFYLFGDLYSTLMVATFFAFLNDSVNSDSAKRLYGLIGLGGVTGGFFGSAVVGVKVKSISPSLSMWLCLGVALAILLVAMGAGLIVKRREAAAGQRAVDPTPEPGPAKASASPAMEGARIVFRSPYLLSIAAIVGLYEMTSTLMDFQFTSAVIHHLDGADIGYHFGRVYPFTNLVAVVIQLFLTSLVMTRLGLGVALLALPVAALAGSAGFMVLPGLLMGSLLNTSDNAFSYSINQSAKEVLYVPTTRDEKYKAKAFIDMFVQRFAKVLTVGLSLLVTTVFVGYGSIRWLSLVTAAILILWICAARYAGRGFVAREHDLST
jgi:ATP:ADP antiporter, AAA family